MRPLHTWRVLPWCRQDKHLRPTSLLPLVHLHHHKVAVLSYRQHQCCTSSWWSSYLEPLTCSHLLCNIMFATIGKTMKLSPGANAIYFIWQVNTSKTSFNRERSKWGWRNIAFLTCRFFFFNHYHDDLLIPRSMWDYQQSKSHSGTAHIPLDAGPDINSSAGAGMGTGQSRIIACMYRILKVMFSGTTLNISMLGTMDSGCF